MTLRLLAAAPVVLCLVGPTSTRGTENSEEHLQTGVLGGVEPPPAEELTEMSESDYILHARDGKLTKVPAEKHKLPHDPLGHDQAVSAVLAADGTVYVGLRTILCKSTDGGRTWS